MNLKKMTLNINGADRMFICDPEKDTLAGVLRRLGLTGTKIGCGTGVCGACSVILDGEVIRSCARKMKNIKEYSEVLTIEGIGTVLYPHPLQSAWVANGAVQCGFCVPGFIVSAYALLMENQDPTREEVRDWFQKHRNVCRCTGYKQIVDAVVDAAAVVRGDKTIDEIRYDWTKDVDEGFYGKPLERPNALAKACGVADYGDDIELKMPAETLKVAMVMPRITNHANIKSIDYSEAEKMPGVVKVITAEDFSEGGNFMLAYKSSPRTVSYENVHQVLHDKKILSWGDVVALVAADTKDHARAAAAKVKVEIEQLPEYMNYLDAVKPDAVRVQPSMPNLFSEQIVLKGDIDNIPEIIDDSEYVVEGSFYSSREPHMSIEGDTVQAYYDEDDNLCIHCKTQTVYFDRADIANALALPEDKVRVIENPTGGSFGWAMTAKTYAMAGIACMATNMPVALSMTWDEFMAVSGKRSPAYSNGRAACDKDGKLTAVQFDFGLDHGSCPEQGDDKLQIIMSFAFFPYKVPNVEGLTRAAVTNHAFGTTYRGYGSPQAYTCSEALMDMLAKKAGIDPFEFRYINIARPGDTTINQHEFLQYPMEEMMDIMRPYYEDAKARAKAEDTPEKRRGVGVAWGGFKVGLGRSDVAEVAIELMPPGSDGRRKFRKYDTWQDQGQGGDAGSLVCTLEALRPFFPDITPDDIKLIQDDTKYCPDTGESAGSRSHFANGKASQVAAKLITDAMRKDDGTYRTYEEMIAEGISTRYDGLWTADDEWGDRFGFMDPNDGSACIWYTLTYALFLAEVEIDSATGKTTVLKYTCVDRVGKVGNILSVDGQAYGGISHSIGFALSEDYEDVRKDTNMLKAGVPYIKDIPDDMTVIHIDAYDDNGPFGSSGASEAFQSADHMAVINAIEDACGVRIYELPARPEKVKVGIEAIKAGKPNPNVPGKYVLGRDYQTVIDEIRANPITID